MHNNVNVNVNVKSGIQAYLRLAAHPLVLHVDADFGGQPRVVRRRRGARRQPRRDVAVQVQFEACKF
jgi:hypothetical protein